MTFPADEAVLNCTVLWDAEQGPRELRLRLRAGATVADALTAARETWADPAMDATALRLGVWGEECAPDRRLHEADRVEIYRPLLNDPREARRQRVQAARRGR